MTVSEFNKIKINNLYLLLLTITSLFFIKSFFLNTLLLVISLITIYYFLKYKINFFNNSINRILTILFCYICLNSFINFNEFDLFLKSIFQLRFFLLIVFIQIFSSFFIKNIKYFFLGNLIIVTLVIIDIFIQYKTGTNLLGYKPQLSNLRFTGIFNEEMIAGSFIFSFGLLGLSFFLIKEKFNTFFLFLLLFSFGIILSGDRSPLLMIFLLFFFNIIFNETLRKHFLLYIVVLFVVVISMTLLTEKSYDRYFKDIMQTITKSQPVFETEYWKNNKERKDIIEMLEKNPNDNELQEKLSKNEKYFQFLTQLENAEKNANNNIFKKSFFIFSNTIYGAHYLTAVEIIKNNKFFGSGIRTFRTECLKYENKILSFDRDNGCSTHPHNLHLEIISEVGIVGYFIFFILLIILFYYVILKKNPKIYTKTLSIYLLSLLFAHLFPFKPSGAIFSTGFGSQIWLIIAINYLFIIKDKQKI